ncbi:M15 family metallopeptidase [Cedecea neteri]|uniref:Peptidase M15 n=1 Tax=Cedecea neteri TaxID=158822 RepID=A0A291DXI4_9ENTR|nr:M15 family metallopeptidase [Cedecea neteri]ATF92399.1 peptidase M15 [Cedecea neteri]
MESFHFGEHSEARLQGVHPDLVKVIRLALVLSPVDFAVTEGLRSVAREKEMVAEGHSETMHSRHLTGHAVDVVAYASGQVSWTWSLYAAIAQAVKQASGQLAIPVEWGGDWHTLKDGAHFQLPFAAYPA